MTSHHKIHSLAGVISVSMHLVLLVGIFTGINLNDSKVNFSENISDISRIKLVISSRDTSKEKTASKSKLKKIEKVVTQKLVPVKSSISKSSTNAGADSELANYLSTIRTLIIKNKVYPLIARRMRLAGDVKVSFDIIWPNNIVDVKVIESSRSIILDKSALKSVKTLRSIPPIPSELNTKIVKVSVPITFEEP